MASVRINKIAVAEPKLDAWDKINTVNLELTREEAKVVFTLLSRVQITASGPAGDAAERVWNAIVNLDQFGYLPLYNENNLFVIGKPELVISSK